MRTVWKYPVPVIDNQLVAIPKGSRILPYVECEGIGVLRLLTFWAEVDTEADKVDRHVHVAGTGNRIPDDLTYVGTARDGMFMWHLYDGGES